jgi:hypothetical protein
MNDIRTNNTELDDRKVFGNGKSNSLLIKPEKRTAKQKPVMRPRYIFFIRQTNEFQSIQKKTRGTAPGACFAKPE